MKTSAKSILLCIALLLHVAASAQPTRLWAYAKYKTLPTGGVQLVDSGLFTYSGNRGIIVDTPKEWFLFLYAAENIEPLNTWFYNPYLTPLPQIVAQYDSYYAWRRNGSVMQPNFTATKFYNGATLDSMHIARFSDPAESFKWIYDTSGRPLASRDWQFSFTTNTWLRTQGYRATRNTAGQPIIWEWEHYDWGGTAAGIDSSLFHYDALGRIDTVIRKWGVIQSYTKRERLRYDGGGRLITWTSDAGSNLQPDVQNSFVYNSASSLCTRMYPRYANSSGGWDTSVPYTYAYDANGRLITHVNPGGSGTNTYHRNSDGLITQITQVGAPGTFNTYFYYDSLGAAGITDAVATTFPLEIYPNPASDRIFVQSAKPLSAYRLCAMTGQEVQSGALDGTQKSISVEGLLPGAYILYTTDQDRSRQATRIIKR